MKIRAALLLCITILFALTPLLLPSFDGYDPQDFPVQIARPSVQPAGYAFSIWLLIYGWLIVHAGFGLIKRATHPMWDRPRPALMAALVLGILWVALAEDHPVAATLTILVMAVAAITTMFLAGRRKRFLQFLPLTLLAGWVTAAAGVASGVTMAGLGWLPDTTSAVVAILAVLAVAVAVQLRAGRAPGYGGAVIWALIGIVAANWGVNPTVAWLAVAGGVVMAGIVALTTRRPAKAEEEGAAE